MSVSSPRLANGLNHSYCYLGDDVPKDMIRPQGMTELERDAGVEGTTMRIAL